MWSGRRCHILQDVRTHIHRDRGLIGGNAIESVAHVDRIPGRIGVERAEFLLYRLFGNIGEGSGRGILRHRVIIGLHDVGNARSGFDDVLEFGVMIRRRAGRDQIDFDVGILFHKGVSALFADVIGPRPHGERDILVAVQRRLDIIGGNAAGTRISAATAARGKGERKRSGRHSAYRPI